MSFSNSCNSIFEQSIRDYHLTDDVDAPEKNPYNNGSIEFLLYRKNWIDTVQWHLEDIVRRTDIDPAAGIAIKRRIDLSNQHRTDVVEYIDSYFLDQYKSTAPAANASINTESPAWAIDRLSILALKIYHMQAETHRTDVSEEHKTACSEKLTILLEQQKDLSKAIDDLLDDIAAGKKFMKVYRQMKMYNDPNLNPALYQKKV